MPKDTWTILKQSLGAFFFLLIGSFTAIAWRYRVLPCFVPPCLLTSSPVWSTHEATWRHRRAISAPSWWEDMCSEAGLSSTTKDCVALTRWATPRDYLPPWNCRKVTQPPARLLAPPRAKRKCPSWGKSTNRWGVWQLSLQLTTTCEGFYQHCWFRQFVKST